MIERAGIYLCTDDTRCAAAAAAAATTNHPSEPRRRRSFCGTSSSSVRSSSNSRSRRAGLASPTADTRARARDLQETTERIATQTRMKIIFPLNGPRILMKIHLNTTRQNCVMFHGIFIICYSLKKKIINQSKKTPFRFKTVINLFYFIFIFLISPECKGSSCNATLFRLATFSVIRFTFRRTILTKMKTTLVVFACKKSLCKPDLLNYKWVSLLKINK